MSRRLWIMAAIIPSLIPSAHALAQQQSGQPLITFHADAMPATKILEALSKQTAIKLADRRQKAQAMPLSVDWQGVPFWQAFDVLAEKANARISLYERDGVIALADGPYVAMPVSYHGIYRLTLKRLTAFRDFETSQGYQTATLEVAWAPPYRAFLIESRPKALGISNEQNRAVPIADEGGGPVAVESACAVTIDVRLPLLPRTSNKISLFRGELNVVGAPKMLTFTFGSLDDLARREESRKQSREGVTVSLSRVELADSVWSIETTLDYPPGGPAFESFQSWLGANELFLSKKGSAKWLNNGGYTMESSSSRRAVLRYYFRDEKGKGFKRGKPGDWTLTYVTPAVLAEAVVPFSFKDVPLP